MSSPEAEELELATLADQLLDEQADEERERGRERDPDEHWDMRHERAAQQRIWRSL